MGDDITVEILKQIRDGISGMRQDFNSRFDALQATVGSLDVRLGSLDVRLGRVENGLSDLGEFMRQIALDQTKHERFHAHHVEVLEKDMEDLRARVRRIEDRERSGG
jgi:hypothetical protein